MTCTCIEWSVQWDPMTSCKFTSESLNRWCGGRIARDKEIHDLTKQVSQFLVFVFLLQETQLSWDQNRVAILLLQNSFWLWWRCKLYSCTTFEMCYKNRLAHKRGLHSICSSSWSSPISSILPFRFSLHYRCICKFGYGRLPFYLVEQLLDKGGVGGKRSLTPVSGVMAQMSTSSTLSAFAIFCSNVKLADM